MPAPGALLAGRYRIIAPLGSGGMATVHRARDERLDREVAVKILLPNHAGDPVLAGRFEREARSLAAAAHPGVVAVFDVDPGDPAAGIEPFFVMELCQGGSLAERLGGGRRLAPDDLIPILISVTDGLAGLHARGVVHRDVKPSNIMLTNDRAKLADFGLARSDDPAELSDLTAPGTAVGTMAYLAPDVLAGGPAGTPSDVYALGVAAFSGLTGSMPRQASSVADLVAAGSRPAPLVSSVAPDLGVAFDEPIAAALDVDPAKRPDALSFGASLAAALGRWSRARPVAGSGAWRGSADPNATTAAVPIAPVAPMSRVSPAAAVPVSPSWSRPVARRSQTGRSLVAAAAVAVLVLAGLAIASGRFALTGAPPDGSPASSSPSNPSSPSPSPSPSASPSPPPTPVPTVSVASRALAALDGVDEAINAARGSDGLKGKDANELTRRVSDIRSALEQGDLDKAAKAANDLQKKVEDLTDDMDDEDAARRLENAVMAVVDILRDR